METNLEIMERLGAHDARLNTIETSNCLWRRQYREDLEKLRDEIRQEFKEIEVPLNKLSAYADRWKFGFSILITLGAVAGWVVSHWDKFSILFK